jgi:hypothetical protein
MNSEKCCVCLCDYLKTQFKQAIFCEHEICLACFPRLSKCPMCRADLFADPDVLIYFEYLPQETAMTLACLEKTQTTLLQKKNMLMSYKLDYMRTFQLCKDFVCRNGPDAIINNIRRLIDNQTHFQDSLSLEPIPFWVFIYPFRNYLKDVENTLCGKIESRKKMIVAMTKNRCVILRRLTSVLTGEHLILKSFSHKLMLAEQSRANAAQDLVDGKILCSTYNAKLVHYSANMYDVWSEMKVMVEIQEQTLEIMNAESMQEDVFEESNMGGSTLLYMAF